MKCKNCQEKEAIKYSKYSNGEFCCKKCARAFSTKEKRKEINEKVRKTLLNRPNPRTGRVGRTYYNNRCPECNRKYKTLKETQKFCCQSCASKYHMNRPEMKEYHRNIQLKLVKEGKHRGWAYRKTEASYPELFFERVLDNNQIEYEREHKEGIYFIDFALNGKIALEIDGKQHKYPERKKMDERKDKFLKKRGWTIYRISWNEINTDSGSLKMKEKIDEFLKWLKY